MKKQIAYQRIAKAAALTLLVTSLLSLVGCGEETTDTWSEISRTGVLQIGTDATYPPFETVDTKSGDVVGFDIDLMRAVCRRYDLQPEFIVTPFDGIVPGLTTKKYDVIISAFTITPQRARKVLFSNPYYDAGQIIAVALDDSVITTLKDLEGLRLGVQLGTTGERMAHRVSGAEIFSYESIGVAFIDLENGRVDAVVNDEPTSRIIIAKGRAAKLVGERLSEEHYGIAVRQGDSTLVEKINHALAVFTDDGTLDSLKIKWFGPPE